MTEQEIRVKALEFAFKMLGEENAKMNVQFVNGILKENSAVTAYLDTASRVEKFISGVTDQS